MEKLRLPFLGPGWFQQARAAGAQRDPDGWYLPAGAVVPAGLRAKIDAAQGDKKRHKVTKNVTSDEFGHLPPWEPSPAELERRIAEGRGALARLGAMRHDAGRAWAVRMLEREAAGDATVCDYARRLSREALMLV